MSDKAARLTREIARLEAAGEITQPLTAIGAWGDAVHCFEPKQVHALIAALAANRPLLVRGEPGVGKSQLARAAAALLGRRFVPAVGPSGLQNTKSRVVQISPPQSLKMHVSLSGLKTAHAAA